jgi:hypothetical protein
LGNSPYLDKTIRSQAIADDGTTYEITEGYFSLEYKDQFYYEVVPYMSKKT